MGIKFQPGDLARIGGKHRPLPTFYPWLFRGRLAKVLAVVGRMPGGHLLYSFASRRGRPAVVLASYDLRTPAERFRRPGGGRRAPKQ